MRGRRGFAQLFQAALDLSLVFCSDRQSVQGFGVLWLQQLGARGSAGRKGHHRYQEPAIP